MRSTFKMLFCVNGSKEKNGVVPNMVGGKILYRTSDVQRTIMSGFKEAYRLWDSW